MKWVKDRTGKFARRPPYLPAELDDECEQLVSSFLKSRHGSASYPITTDDLTVLIESLTETLDLYADLANEGGEIEGVTDFIPRRHPKVRISKRLTEDKRMSNRFRTTLTHELGHVHFHSPLFDGEQSGDLFDAQAAPQSNRCTRATILQAAQTDWMEWQAGYACGAFLMPATALACTIREFLHLRQLTVARFGVISAEGQELIQAVCDAYEVSRDAARVRLQQRGNLVGSDIGVGLV
jgi:Zn-dependent peptidase ImmA (M78 family)